MPYVWHYLYEYIKTGKFTLWMLMAIGFLFALRFLLRKVTFKLDPGAVFIVICAIGLLLRVGWLTYSSHEIKFAWSEGAGGLRGGIGETDIINIHAAEIKEGKWFLHEDGRPSARRPIGYPIVLGFLYKFLGARTGVAWSFHLLLYVGTFWFIYRMAQHLFDKKVEAISALLFAINPISIYSTKLIVDEHLFLPLWYGGLLLLFEEIKGLPLKSGWLWYGLIFGAAAVTRTYAIMMPAIVALGLWAQQRDWKKVAANFLLIFLAMQVINLPWLVRNYKAYGVPLVYAAAAHSLYFSTNPSATPQSDGHPQQGQPGYSAEFEEAGRTHNEGLVQRAANRAIADWVISSPIAFFDLGVSKVLYFMHWGKRMGVWPLWYQFQEGHYDASRKIPDRIMDGLKQYAFFFYYLIFHFFVFAVLWIWFYGKRHIPRENLICIGILLSCIACWLLMHMIIMPDPKYRYPLEPLMAIFAAYVIRGVIWGPVPTFLSNWRYKRKRLSAGHDSVKTVEARRA